MVSLWTVLTAIAPILAPIISLILVFIGRVIWNHEKRLRSLEDAKVRHGRTLYGDDDDLQQTGLSADLTNVIDRLEHIESKIDTLNGNYDDPDD